MSKLGAERMSYPIMLRISCPAYIRRRLVTGLRCSLARINSRLLSQYKGHTVRLTGKVLKMVGDTATVQASDGGEVSLSLRRAIEQRQCLSESTHTHTSYRFQS